MDITTPEQTKL